MRRTGVSEAIFFGSRADDSARPHSDLNLVLLSDAFAGRPLCRLLEELQKQWKLDLLLEMLPVGYEEFEQMKEFSSLASEADSVGIRIRIEPQTEGREAPQ